VLGDGHGVEAGHVGDPHPFVGGRVKVDVVDPYSELLDEAEAPGPDGPPGELLFLLRGVPALTSSGGAKVDEVAAVRGVVPDAGLVLRAVVEDHRAERIPACFEAGPQLMLLGEQDVAEHGAGDLAPSPVLGREGQPPLIEGHPPAELIEQARQVRLGPGLCRRSAGFELGL
jgi:hypothetical protein